VVEILPASLARERGRRGRSARHAARARPSCPLARGETAAIFSSPAAIGYGVMAQDLYRGCLRARGYQRSKEYEPVPPGYYRGIE
jgi:hypothetical protein